MWMTMAMELRQFSIHSHMHLVHVEQQQNWSWHQKHVVEEYCTCIIVCVCLMRAFMQYLCTFIWFHFSKYVYNGACSPIRFSFSCLHLMRGTVIFTVLLYVHFRLWMCGIGSSYRGHRNYPHLTWCTGLCVTHKNLTSFTHRLLPSLPTASWASPPIPPTATATRQLAAHTHPPKHSYLLMVVVVVVAVAVVVTAMGTMCEQFTSCADYFHYIFR